MITDARASECNGCGIWERVGGRRDIRGNNSVLDTDVRLCFCDIFHLFFSWDFKRT